MASKFNFLAFAIAISVQATLGEVLCEELDENKCASAVSYDGRRCILEKYARMRGGREEYTCRTSEIEAANVLETDTCMEACGLDRKTLRVSSDSLHETRFTSQLCSARCYSNCPNVVDLYSNLAAYNGVILLKICEGQLAENVRREMDERSNSGFVKFEISEDRRRRIREIDAPPPPMKALAPMQSEELFTLPVSRSVALPPNKL